MLPALAGSFSFSCKKNTLIQKKSCRFLVKTGHFDIKNSYFNKNF